MANEFLHSIARHAVHLVSRTLIYFWSLSMGPVCPRIMVSVARPRHVLFAVLVTAGCFILLSSFSFSASNFSPFDRIPESITPELADSISPTYDLSEAVDTPPIPTTNIPGGAHSYGYTIFDNLYLRNGTLYVVTPHRSSFPTLDALIAAPLDMGKDVDLTANDSVYTSSRRCLL